MKQEFGKIRLFVDNSVWDSVEDSVRNYLAKSVVGFGGFSVASSVSDSVLHSVRDHLMEYDFKN